MSFINSKSWSSAIIGFAFAPEDALLEEAVVDAIADEAIADEAVADEADVNALFV